MAKYVSTNTNDISSAEPNETKPYLILAQFKNGNLKPSAVSKLKFTSYKNDVQKSKRILVAKSSRLCYAGSNFESDIYKITSSVLKVCVLNRKDLSLKLYDADYFHLRPQLKCPETLDVKCDKTYSERSSDLTCAFGSKIQKRKINSNMKYGSSSINATITEDMLTEISETVVTENSANTSNQNVSSVIPPQNSSAVNVDEVYNLYDIIPKEDFDMLDTEAQIFLDVTEGSVQVWKIEKRYPDFIIQFMENNIFSMDMYKAKLLCYLNYMFCFLKTTYADWRKKDPVPGVPYSFKQKLMDSFTINKTMPVRLKDKLLAYAIVLGLKLNNNVINCNIFGSSMKMAIKRMTSVAYALGCHVSQNKMDSAKVIELKLPLFKFRDVSRKRKK